MQQQRPRLGLALDTSLTVKEVISKGPCDGHLRVGDKITHVNSVSVQGKDQQAVVELCNTSWRVILDVLRSDEQGATSNSIKILIRLPLTRPVHTRDQIKGQIHQGRKLRKDDSEIRQAFLSQAQKSTEAEKFAHIPKKDLLPALAKLGIVVPSNSIEDFFAKSDTDGDGLIDRDEFLNIVLHPPNLPTATEILGHFNKFSKVSGIDGAQHIDLKDLDAALQSLKLDSEVTRKIFLNFPAEATKDGKITFDEFNQAVLSIFPLRDEMEVMEVYEEYSVSGLYEYIPAPKLRAALEKLGLLVTDEQIREHMRMVDLNFGGSIRFNAFKQFVQSPSPLEVWAQTLPLAKLLADALPRNASCDHLRVISSLTPQEIVTVSEEVAFALQDILRDQVRELRKSFEVMDKMVLKSGVHSASKFEVCKMTGGTIEDFYEGLEGRIGTCPPNFKAAMEAEHCSRGGCEYVFTTLNYTDIRTFPKREWEIIMKEVECSKHEMRFNRRIPDLEKLFKLPLAKRASLSQAEVISVVLYTGPMYVIYNGILRKYPVELFKYFESMDNLFSTTIFVLASAIQKISRVMKLPTNMVLYRGLGGKSDLPDSFFKADMNGCRGFVEWGFMSTSANKQVAINYSGLDQQRPLPIVLSIQVGAADRGACVRDFSQYTAEVEYLYAPMSFIEQVSAECMEVTAYGVVRVLPVKVNANLKTENTDELEKKKKTLHLASFKYRIHEIQKELEDLAQRQDAENRLQSDTSSDGLKLTVALFLEKIVLQCKEVYARHLAVPHLDYLKDTKFRSLVLEMVDIKDMAIAKLEEWLVNKKTSFIRYRFGAELRTAHRRWTMFLEKLLITCSDQDRREASLRVLKSRGFVIDNVNETNELGESRCMTMAADGRSKWIFQLLVDANGDVNGARDKDGVTPIWVAAQFDHKQTVMALFELKANVNQAARNGATPLYTAAQSGNKGCIAALAQLKADVCQADKDGVTPVHQAAMNGFVDCIQLLLDLKASVNQEDTNKMTPYDHAIKNGHSECAAFLQKLSGPPVFLRTPSKSCSKKLIISTGDVSDIDGFMALAHYRKSGADVLFVMNYPAYLGIDDNDVDPKYAELNMGLGYKYSAEQIIDSDKATESYRQFLSNYEGTANERIKCALTDIAFLMAKKIWNDSDSDGQRVGNLLFCIGGVNAVNPFSQSAIKNEILVYSEFVSAPETKVPPIQGQVYSQDGLEDRVDWEIYSDIYIDFNGSMAFWDESWRDLLTAHQEKVRGTFVMGGVIADQAPITMPPIPNVLNRFSGATMNQLYHPECTARFFGFIASIKVPVFVITNNVVKDLATVSDGVPTYEGVERFLNSNGLTGTNLMSFAKAHYTSVFKPPRKPFDFYTALALERWIASEHKCPKLTSATSRRWLFYSNVYGITYVSKSDKWEDTRASYVKSVDITENEGDPPFVMNKKEYFRREFAVLESIPFVGTLPVYEVAFSMDSTSKLLALA